MYSQVTYRPNKGIARKNDKNLINVSGPNKHIAGETLKFTGLNYLRLCHYFVLIDLVGFCWLFLHSYCRFKTDDFFKAIL